MDHQIQTIENLDEQFAKQNNKALVVLPSGSGKTHTIAFHVARLKPKSFLYVVHQNSILTQTVEIFREVCGLNDDQIGIINQKLKQYDRQYIFATMQTLAITKNMNKLSKTVDYMVIDEYHHAAAPSYKKILAYFKPHKLIGLSATPYRLDKKDIMEAVDNNIANEIDLFDGVKHKILVPFHYIGLYDNIDYSTIKHQGYKYSVTDIDKKLIIHKRDEAVIREYNEKIRPEHRLTIGFCNSIAHVRRITKKFRNQGIKAVGITHKDPQNVRQQIIEEFRGGEKHEVLFTRDILNEGVDFPECSALLFLRPTTSKTIFLQQLGRGLRKKQGKTDVLVLDFIGNYIRAFKKREWFQGAIIKKLRKGGKIAKPVYEYNFPKPVVEFDEKVIEIMELQEKYHRDYQWNITKQMVYDDYIKCCNLHKPKPKYLTHPEYMHSPHRKQSDWILRRLYGTFGDFIRENNIPRDSRNFRLDFKYKMPVNKQKQELIDNYYRIKEIWKQDPNRPPYENHPSVSKYLTNRKISKYPYSYYRRMFGSYRQFLIQIGEIKNSLDMNISKLTNQERVDLLQECITKLQTKLGQKGIRHIDWKKEYDRKFNTEINRLGGWDEFRRRYKIPKHIQTCDHCGVKYTDENQKRISNLCGSPSCKWKRYLNKHGGKESRHKDAKV